MQFNSTGFKAFPNNDQLAVNRRLVLTAGYLALAGATVAGLGTNNVRSETTDESCTVQLWNTPGTRFMIASGAIAQNATVFAAASGKVAATGSVPIGVNLGAASTADGDLIEVLPFFLATNGYAVQPIEAITAARTLLASESGLLITNQGAAGALVASLPDDPPVGTLFRFTVLTAQELRIDPPAGDQLIVNGATQTAGKYVGADDEGESIELVYLGGDKWIGREVTGTWTVEA